MIKTLKIYLIIVILSLLSASGKDLSDYEIDFNITGSPSFSIFKDDKIPGIEDKTSIGYGFTGRLMWHPGRNLSFGIMSGYLQLAYDKIEINPTLNDGRNTTVYATLKAVPLQFVVTTQKHGFEGGLGMGPYILISKIDYETIATSYRYELGLTLFSSYSFAIAKQLNLGPEIRILYLSYRGIFSIMPSFNARYTLWSY